MPEAEQTQGQTSRRETHDDMINMMAKLGNLTMDDGKAPSWFVKPNNPHFEVMGSTTLSQ